jgi:hypothetical protein
VREHNCYPIAPSMGASVILASSPLTGSALLDCSHPLTQAFPPPWQLAFLYPVDTIHDASQRNPTHRLEEALAKDGRASAVRAYALEGVGWLADLQGAPLACRLQRGR